MINLESFEVQARNKKKNNKQSEYKIDNENDSIKIKTVRFPNNRNRLMKKLNDRTKQKSKFNSLYLLPKSKAKNQRLFFKNSSLSVINHSNKDIDIYKNRNNSSVEESINNYIFNINEFRNNVNKNNSNNSLINISSSKTINSEKTKIKKKLDEYNKLIDLKLNRLKRKNHLSVNDIKNSFINFKLCNLNKKHILFSNYNNISSNILKYKKRVLCASNKSYRYVNNKNKNF